MFSGTWCCTGSVREGRTGGGTDEDDVALECLVRPLAHRLHVFDFMQPCERAAAAAAAHAALVKGHDWQALLRDAHGHAAHERAAAAHLAPLVHEHHGEGPREGGGRRRPAPSGGGWLCGVAVLRVTARVLDPRWAEV